MRQVSWTAAILIASASGLCALGAPAAAQDYIIQQNQNGFDLPGVTLPQGQDEVRASDGTTCSSAVSGTGAYLDVGVIRGTRTSKDTNDFATYGRVVVPLGRKPKRLDCSQLYKLEVERLKLELELMKMGVGSETTPEITNSTDGAAPVAAEASAEMTSASTKKVKPVKAKAKKKNWANEGWSDKSNQ